MPAIARVKVKKMRMRAKHASSLIEGRTVCGRAAAAGAVDDAFPTCKRCLRIIEAVIEATA